MRRPTYTEFKAAIGQRFGDTEPLSDNFNPEQNEAAVEAYARFNIMARLIGAQLMLVGLSAKFNLKIERKPS